MNKKLLIILILFFVVGFSYTNASFAEDIPVAAKETSAGSQAPLKGGVTVNITSDHIEYLQDKDQFVGTGNVKLQVEDQDTVVEADKITFDQTNNVVIAEKNVKITKNNQTINGDYAKMELDKESMLINNPNTTITQLNIEAKTANIYPSKANKDKKDIDVLTGKATISDKNLSFILSRSGSKFINNNLADNKEKKSVSSSNAEYKVHSKEILVKREKDRDVITLLKSTISINKYPIAKIPSLTLSTNKESHQVEDNLPEVGQIRELGVYAGWGPVLNLPHASTLKLVPIMTFGKKLGIGELTRFTSSTNRTEAAYSTLKKAFVIKGEQQLPIPTAKIQYGTNSYIENGFFGRQRPNMIIEAVDSRKLASAFNFDFNLRSSAAYIVQDHRWGTGRFQIQGDLLNQRPIINLGKHVSIGANSQFDISVYGNGDTFGVLRAGPTIDGSLGPLSARVAYYQGGIYGETPLLVDRYYYGRRNISLNTTYKINRYFTMGYLGSFNLSKDNWDKKLIAENQFYCWAGPDDLKFKLGYDTRRRATTFDFNILLGSDRSAINFDKLKVREN